MAEINNVLAHSSLAKRVLKKCQVDRSMPTIKMPSACTIRWWSQSKQLQFVVTNTKELTDFCFEYTDGINSNLSFNATEIKKITMVLAFIVELEKMQTTLKPYQNYINTTRCIRLNNNKCIKLTLYIL